MIVAIAAFASELVDGNVGCCTIRGPSELDEAAAELVWATVAVGLKEVKSSRCTDDGSPVVSRRLVSGGTLFCCSIVWTFVLSCA